jgi:hypothetical protein
MNKRLNLDKNGDEKYLSFPNPELNMGKTLDLMTNKFESFAETRGEELFQAIGLKGSGAAVETGA